MVEDMGDFGTGVTPPEPDVTPAPRQRSRSKARGAAAGVGVALVVGAGGIAVATSGSSATAPGASPTSEGATPAPGASGQPSHPGAPGTHGFRGRGPGGMGGFGGRGLAGGPVLHGTFVITKSGGGYQTVQEQTGTVDSVTATTLVVTSKDSFKGTYVVTSSAIVDAQRDGISSVKTGDEVVVSATVSGSTVTVTRIEDLTELKKNRPAFTGGAGPEGFQGQGGTHTRRGSGTAAPASPGAGT